MIEFEKLKIIYNVGKGLKLEDLTEIFKSTQQNTYPSHTDIIKENSVRRDIFFIKKGLLRSFAINSKGEEITISLRTENQFFTNHDVILFNRPSRFYFQTLEQTELLSMDYDLLQKIVDKSPKLEKYRKHILLKMLEEASGRIESFTLLSPEERYIEYAKDNPDLISRVPNKYIANILGITPVSLSRIRKRIVQKNRKS